MKDDCVSNWFTTGTSAVQPKEGTLFYEAVIEPQRDVDHAGNDAAAEPRPNLTLVRDDDDDLEESILREHGEPLDTDAAMIAESAPARADEKEGDAWPWEDEVESSMDDLAEVRDQIVPQISTMNHVETETYRSSHAPVHREHDHSATQDVILCEPSGILCVEETAETEESTAVVEKAAEGGCSTSIDTHTGHLPAHTPKRIGSGQLVPARLTWRPGDPFGGDASGRSRFRWEVMLTSACVTAACGLGCIWLLRTLLA